MVADAVAGGINLVQLREKDLPTRPLLELARELRAAIEPRAQLIVNGRADVAVAAGAAGVHLPADGLPSEGARAALGPAAMVGRAVHSAEEARALATEDLDYVQLGTIFDSRSHPQGPTIGVEAVRQAASCGVPVLGIGGITVGNAASVIQAGAHGVAVISAILGQPRPARAARELCEAVQEAWHARALMTGS